MKEGSEGGKTAPPRYEEGNAYYSYKEEQPTPLVDWKGPPTFGQGKKAEGGKVTRGITLTPQYREGDAHYSPREDCTYSYDEEKGPPLCEEEQKGVGGRDTEGRRQEQHVAVSIEAPRLPELRRRPNPIPGACQKIRQAGGELEGYQRGRMRQRQPPGQNKP